MRKIESLSRVARDLNTSIYNLVSTADCEDGWETRVKQENFRELCRIEDMAIRPFKGGYCGLEQGAHVLDVGCGTGDFYPYLKKRKIHSYIGVDIHEPSLIRARQKYPGINVLSADILAGEFSDTFDYVFASGSLSIRQPDSDNYDFLESMVDAMWSMTRHGLAFNVLTDNSPYNKDGSLAFFYNVDKVKAICQNLAPEAEVVANLTPIITPKIPAIQQKRDWEGQAHIYLFRNISTRTPLFP